MLPRCTPTASLVLAGMLVACLSSLLAASIASARGWTAPALLAAVPALLACAAAAAMLRPQKRRRGWAAEFGVPEPLPPASVSGPFGAYRAAWSV